MNYQVPFFSRNFDQSSCLDISSLVKVWATLYLLFLGGPLIGQTLSPETDTTSKYTFIDTSKGSIQLVQFLDKFFLKLNALEHGKLQQLRIAHIGDSHIQADLFSGELRALFQKEFGSAGRGLGFFYQQAGTHSPLDLKTESSNTWTSRRRIFQKKAPPIGISGMSIQTEEPSFEIYLYQKDKYGIEYPFNQITLFHNAEVSNYTYSVKYEALGSLKTVPPLHQSWSQYEVKKGDTLFSLGKRFSCGVEELKTWNQLSNNNIYIGQQLQIKKPGIPPGTEKDASLSLVREEDSFTSQIILPNLAEAFQLFGNRKEGKTGVAQLFGFLLEDTNARGILYNMMGVNGATFYHFNHGEQFKDQLKVIQPDLFIITLGTNEAIQSKFYPDQVEREVRTFLQHLKETYPDASVLLTINPDVLRKKKYSNPNSEKVRAILIEAAEDYGVAYWDLFQLMGGLESAKAWRAAELMYVDYIHFTKKGYILQAHLLYEALMEAYHAGN